MSIPSVCVIFNNVDEASSIGSLCAWSVRTALEAGWRVSVVARDLDPTLRGNVEWIPMYVPPRLHAVQWYSALPAVRYAIRGRSWDVVHVQQPQLASVANLLHLHYLVRSARLAAPRQKGRNLRQSVGAAQARLTEVGESWCLAHLPERLTLAPVSAMLRDEYVKHFGPHERIHVLESPAPALAAVTADERATARRELVGDRRGVVVGFLGGDDPRKGGSALARSLRGAKKTTVVVGGSGSAAIAREFDPGQVVDVGYVTDKRSFFSGLDVFAAVSNFDPGPLTALEAVSFGVRVVGTRGCGFLRDLDEVGGALIWDGAEPFENLIEDSMQRSDMAASAVRLLTTRSVAAQGAALLRVYSAVRGV